MATFKLNKLALALSLGVVSSLPAVANIQVADSQTQVSKKQGIEIINIARPNDNGLSHNKYQQFNVEKQGAVLNNALQNGRSELAGDLTRNPNLQQQAAKVILNEVVSRNPSTLKGKQEVFGQRADYVLANPNGITCDGCGFINTPRASLVVGRADVTNSQPVYHLENNNALVTKGKISNKNVDQIDLVAPKVNISGEISGTKNINVIMGQGSVLLDQQGNTYVSPSKATKGVLDGQVVGSMYADRIRIHAVNDKSNLKVEAATIQAKETEISAGNLDVKGKITKSQNRTHYDKTDAKKVRATGGAETKTESYAKTTIQSDKLTLTANNKLNLTGAEINGKVTAIEAGSVNFGTQTTTNASKTLKNQSKLSWHRNESDFSDEQKLHRTVITSDALTVVANSGKITGSALKANVKEMGLYGEKGIALAGGVETNQYRAISSFRNESAKLKTGSANQNAMVQNYVASDISVKNQLVIGGNGNARLAGVKLAVDGDLVAKTPNKIEFVAESAKQTYQINDDHRFWGGLAGAKSVGTARNEVVHYGTDISVKNDIRLEAKQGATIKGSRVVAQGDGYVIAPKGSVLVDASYNHLTTAEHYRKGGAFNITTLRHNQYSQSSTAKGAVLKSDANLYVATDKKLAVNGSQVQAGGLLDISARSGIEIAGARNVQHSQVEKTSLTFNGKVAKPEVKLDLDAKGFAKLLLQSAFKESPVKNLVDGVKDKVTASASAAVGLKVDHSKENSQNVTYSAASVSGGSTHLAAQTVNVKGSQVAATSGDLTIEANKINTAAQYNQSSSHKKETNVALELNVDANQDGITSKLGLSVKHSDANNSALTAQGSQLSAKNDLNLTAQHIRHQGSTLNAGHDINQTAKQIHHLAANNQKNKQATNVNVDLSLTAGIDKSKVINASLGLNVEGGRSDSSTQNAQVTKLNAGNNIHSHSALLNDQGSQYTAANSVNLTSQRHLLVAAQNQAQSNSVSGGVNLSVSGNSKDLNTVNAQVGVGVKFKKGSTAESSEQAASIQANNVNVQTGKLNAQANIQANNAHISASESATFSQLNNQKTQKEGGFSANVKVGALVIPSAGVAVPSVDTKLSVNGKKSDSLTGQSTQLNGKNQLTIESPTVSLQGTNVNGGKVNLNGQNVKVEGLNSSASNLAVDVGLGVSVGAKLANSGFDAKLKVQKGQKVEHESVALNGSQLAINTENAHLAGVSSTSENVVLNVDNLALTALANSNKQTDVGLGLALKGSGVGSQWKPASGSASVDVNVVRNETVTGTTVKTDSATINSQNVLLEGSSVNANSASGQIGHLTEKVLNNKVNEVSVSAAASGSGKPTAYTKENAKQNLKKDWESGTIAGVKGEVKVDVSVNQQHSNTAVGIQAQNNALKVNKKSHTGKRVKPKSHRVQVNAKVNTNLKESTQKIKDAIKNRTVPFVTIKR